MKHLITILLLISTVSLSAQVTLIPDANFEQALINLGLDATIDGQVLKNNIDTLTVLYIPNFNINSLTGIQDFTALKELWCSGNQLTSLDLTQNMGLIYLIFSNNQITSINLSQNLLLEHLESSVNPLNTLTVTSNSNLNYLECFSNQLSSLDVTQNPVLDTLNCGWNQITSLDVTQNPNLQYFKPEYNQLTTLDVSQNSALVSLIVNTNLLSNLDVSQNPLLIYLDCGYNQLNCLNMKTGNNVAFIGMSTINNPNLTCIEVDSVAFSTANWTPSNNFHKDIQTSFNVNCGPFPCNPVSINHVKNIHNLKLFPNPTSSQLTISLEKAYTGSYSVLNSLGQVVLEDNFNNSRDLDISLNGPSGLYFLQLEVDGQVITKKVVKE